MKSSRYRPSRVLLEASMLDLDTPNGRPLFRGLEVSLSFDKVAVIGRNGAGKSSLLDVLAGIAPPTRGHLALETEPILVPQELNEEDCRHGIELLLAAAKGSGIGVEALASEVGSAGLPNLRELERGTRLSLGELRKLHLVAAKLAQPDLLLLDEPTHDLDQHGRAWLRDWLTEWRRGLLLVSHDRHLLRHFRDFFLVAESGCRHFAGTLDELDAMLEREEAASQQRYVRRLNVLLQREKHSEKFRRRRERKKNVGRVRELGRMTPRSRLNQKRSYAQEKQGRINRIRRQRIAGVRAWAKAARRALLVNLPLDVVMPRLPEPGTPVVVLDGVTIELEGRTLFTEMSLRVGRDRLAVMGPNGAGKTTLVRVMLGLQAPTQGVGRRDPSRIGAIAQGGTDWMLDESLLEYLARTNAASVDRLADQIVAHRFPLALAERSLASLSPGERVRAALICLLQRQPPVELLVLDEPTYAVDFVGASALRSALRAWPGGLVVVSHDEDFIESIGVEQHLTLDLAGSHRTGLSALWSGGDHNVLARKDPPRCNSRVTDEPYKSDIPAGATERKVSPYQHEGHVSRLERRECVLDGQVVGMRCYHENGRIAQETPMLNGVKHGTEYFWNDDGSLDFAEPFVNGKMHGTCRQWDWDGLLIGTYEIVNGTGIDVWRHREPDGTIGVSETHPLVDGWIHGLDQWWSNDHEVYEETHYVRGKKHGIYRHWTDGRLDDDCPKFWVNDEEVSREDYLRAAGEDPTLPPLRPEDDDPTRKLPEGVE